MNGFEVEIAAATPAGEVEPDIHIFTDLRTADDGSADLRGVTLILGPDLARRMVLCGGLIHELPPVELMKWHGLMRRSVDLTRPTAQVVSVMAREIGAALAIAYAKGAAKALQTPSGNDGWTQPGGTANAG